MEGKKRAETRRVVRPRKRKDLGEYDTRDYGNVGGNLMDQCFAKDAPPIRVVRPSWNGELPLCFRAFPTVDPETGYDFLPGRRSADDGGFTDWYRVFPAVKFLGTEDNNKLTCLLYDYRWIKSRGYAPSTDNPYLVFYNALRNVCDVRDQKSEPKAMLGSKNVMTTQWPIIFKNLCNPKTRFAFFQGAVFQNNDKVYVKGGKKPFGLGDDDLPTIIEIQSDGAVKSFTSQVNARVESPESDSIDAQFVTGDPVDLSTGKFFTVFNPKKHKPKVGLLTGAIGASSAAETAESEEEDVAYEEPSSGDGKKEGGFVGWEVTASPDMYYINDEGKRKKAKGDISAYDDVIRSRFLWWDDLLYFPETEELCLWLARAFASVPNMVRFAFLDNPEFMTSEVKGVFSARTSGPGAEIPSDSEGSRKKKKTRAPVEEEEEDADEVAEDDAEAVDDEELSDIDDSDVVDADESELEDDAELDVDAEDSEIDEEALDESEDSEDADAGDEDDESLANEDADDDGFADEAPRSAKSKVNQAVAAAKARSAKRQAASNEAEADDDAPDEESTPMAKKPVAKAKKPAVKKPAAKKSK